MSNIIYNTIDEDYPIAGQDNDSQGFRDNFSIIKIALTTAESEISALENSTAKLGEVNNFLGGTISNVILNNTFTTTSVAIDDIVDVSGTGNSYFKITKSTSNPIVITWPTNAGNNHIKIRLEIFASGDRTISFAGTSVKTNFSNALAMLNNEIAVFDCWVSTSTSPQYIQFIDKFA